MKRAGKVAIIGAGPGDPELMTLRALKLLKKADVVLHDRLISKEVLSLIAPRARLVYVGKKASFHTLPQDQIEDELVRQARAGKRVVRLKGGDPYIFGRGGEEAERLADEGIDFEVVPGISSALAAPLLAGIPLTHRRYTPSIAIVTGHENPEKTGELPYQKGKVRQASLWVDWQALAKMGTVVFLMGVGNVRANMQKLMEHGKSPDTPAAVIRWASLGKQRKLTATVATLADTIDQNNITSPAVIVVGGVVELSDKLDFFSRKRLHGKRIIITRDPLGNAELAQILSEEGADVINWPTITYKPLKMTQVLTRQMRHISTYDWLVFTSQRGVDFFMRHFFRLHRDVRALKNIKIAVVGKSTEEALQKYSLKADLVPQKQTSENLAKSSVFKGKKRLKIFVVQPDDGLGVFENILGKKHFITLAVLYRKKDSVPEQTEIGRVTKKGVDWVLFFSPSAATSFLRHFPEGKGLTFLSQTRVACIGPTTAKFLKDQGVAVAYVSNKPDIKSLLKGLC